MAPQTWAPGIGYAPYRIRKSRTSASTISIGAVGQERGERGPQDLGDLVRRGAEDGPAGRQREDRGDPVAGDRDPERLELAEHPDARGVGIQGHLLGGLPERRRGEIAVAGLGPTAGEGDLAAVVAAPVDPPDQEDLGVGIGVAVTATVR